MGIQSMPEVRFEVKLLLVFLEKTHNCKQGLSVDGGRGVKASKDVQRRAVKPLGSLNSSRSVVS